MKEQMDQINKFPWECAVLLLCVEWERVPDSQMEVLSVRYSDNYYYPIKIL